MVKIRPQKVGALRPGGWGDSRAKAGVWFAQQRAYKATQRKIIARLKEDEPYLDVKDAILIVDPDGRGVTLIAPNPSLPGIFVLPNGNTPLQTKRLQAELDARIAAIADDLKVELLPRRRGRG